MVPDTWTFTLDGLQIELPVAHTGGEMFIPTAESLDQEQRDLIAETVIAHILMQTDEMRRAADAG